MPAGPHHLRLAVIALIVLFAGSSATAQLNENCTVSVLNRTVQVKADGSWVLPNVPANFGQVKARATCVQNGVTTSGESAFFAIPANSAVNLPEILLGSGSQIPVSLGITPTNPAFTALGQTIQLSVTATYPDSSTTEVASASSGTNYTTSNPAIVTVSPDGLLTAIASGTVVIQASNDGAAGMTTARVTLMAADTDGDGIPDSVEVELGLDPQNPVDAQEDFDRDGLTNLQEYEGGTDLRNADTDADGLLDGDEITRGTSPLLADTDGDLIPDGIEVQNGTNPLDSNSFDLSQAVSRLRVDPASFVMTVNTLDPNASQQLAVTGELIDGKTVINLTSRTRGTNYSTSNIAVCNFGAPDGRVFAGSNGTCTITVSNSGLSAVATGTVDSFTPSEVSAVGVAGAIAVDVTGNFAYVAAGTNGLVVVDVSDRSHPRTRGTLAGIGSAQGIRAVGSSVYIADSTGWLRVVGVTNPDAPLLLASLPIAGAPIALAVHAGMAAVAAQGGGVGLVNVTDPSTPNLIATISTPASAVGVDFDPQRGLAAVAMGTGGLQIVDISSSASPQLSGRLAGGSVRRVLMKFPAVLLADTQRSISAVDITNPGMPLLSSSIPSNLGGAPVDIAVSGNIGITADASFGRVVPIFNVSNPLMPNALAFWTLGSLGFSTSIAMDNSYGYLILPNFLRIFHFRKFTDAFGIPPVIQITSPTVGPLIEGATVTISANATDDIAVASVAFFVNGLVAGSSASSPYQLNHTVPVGATTITFGATAIDYGNNVGAAPNVTLQVIPDPLTSAQGRVVDSGGTPVGGATVSAFSQAATSAADGAFTLPGLPTIRGPIAVLAVATLDGVTVSGLSAASTPVAGGITSVGDIQVFPKPLITGIKSKYVLAGAVMEDYLVTGANLLNTTFSLLPVTIPPPITFSVISVSPSGDSANLTLTVAAGASGEYVLIGTSVAGTSEVLPENSITIIDPATDSDGDGLSNADEVPRGTDPFNQDTDGDGWPDGLEVALDSNPLDANSQPVLSQFAEPSASFVLLNRALPTLTDPVPVQPAFTWSLLNRALPTFTEPVPVQPAFTWSLLNRALPTLTEPVPVQPAFTWSLLNQALPTLTEPVPVQPAFTWSVLNRALPTLTEPVPVSASFTFSLLNRSLPFSTDPVLFDLGLIFSVANVATAALRFESNLVDTDGDGLPNGVELALSGNRVGARPEDDDDGDDLSNIEEVRLGTNAGRPDTDNDGLNDGEEHRRFTDPGNPDSDGDRFGDGDEVAEGSDPLDPSSVPASAGMPHTFDILSPEFRVKRIDRRTPLVKPRP